MLLNKEIAAEPTIEKKIEDSDHFSEKKKSMSSKKSSSSDHRSESEKSKSKSKSSLEE